MSKSFYMGGAWAKHELRWRQNENRYEAYEGQEPGANGRIKASVAAFDSADFHYQGDAINILKEEPVGDGSDVEVTFQRWSDDGKTSRGTYKTTLRKTGPGRIETTGRARRIYSF